MLQIFKRRSIPNNTMFRVYKQEEAANLKIQINAGAIDVEKSAWFLTNFAKDIDLESTWYNDAHDYALSLAKHFNVDLRKVCDVIAALSPMVRWNYNKKVAFKCILAWQSNERVQCHMFKNNSNKAYDILDGKPYKLGQKTKPFAGTIFDPEHTNVTIDSIAMSILFNLADLPGSYKIFSSELIKAQQVYTMVADLYNVTPTQLQASVWIKARQLRQPSNQNVGGQMLEFYTETNITNPYIFAERFKNAMQTAVA